MRSARADDDSASSDYDSDDTESLPPPPPPPPTDSPPPPITSPANSDVEDEEGEDEDEEDTAAMREALKEAADLARSISSMARRDSELLHNHNHNHNHNHDHHLHLHSHPHSHQHTPVGSRPASPPQGAESDDANRECCPPPSENLPLQQFVALLAPTPAEAARRAAVETRVAAMNNADARQLALNGTDPAIPLEERLLALDTVRQYIRQHMSHFGTCFRIKELLCNEVSLLDRMAGFLDPAEPALFAAILYLYNEIAINSTRFSEQMAPLLLELCVQIPLEFETPALSAMMAPAPTVAADAAATALRARVRFVLEPVLRILVAMCKVPGIRQALVARGVFHHIVTQLRHPQRNADPIFHYWSILLGTLCLFPDTRVLAESVGAGPLFEEIIEQMGTNSPPDSVLALIYMACDKEDLQEAELPPAVTFPCVSEWLADSVRTTLEQRFETLAANAKREGRLFRIWTLHELMQGAQGLARRLPKLVLESDLVELCERIIRLRATDCGWDCADLKLGQELAASTLWHLSFDESGRQHLLARKSLVELLIHIKEESATQKLYAHMHKDVGGTLFALGIGDCCLRQPKSTDGSAKTSKSPTAVMERVDPDVQQSLPSPPTPVAVQTADSSTTGSHCPHVMLSYCWSDQPFVLKIRNRLKELGLPVWMDVDEMHGSTLEAMADAVERAAVVVVCLSSSYKDSAACRTEAEYAYQLRKPIIPVKPQPYDPKGWLGALLGTRLYHDFSVTDEFDSRFDGLAKDLEKHEVQPVSTKTSGEEQHDPEAAEATIARLRRELEETRAAARKAAQQPSPTPSRTVPPTSAALPAVDMQALLGALKEALEAGQTKTRDLVSARFDSLEAQLATLDARLAFLESSMVDSAVVEGSNGYV